MSFITQDKTNLKYILIVVILAAIVGGGILSYLYWTGAKQEQAKQEQEEIENLKTACLEKNTTEACISYSFNIDTRSCLSMPIDPCCGNNVCEVGERDTCNRDCKITVSQNQKDTAFPVQFFTPTGDFQAVVQTFVSPDDNLELIEIAPYIDYSVGSRAYLVVYELSDLRKPTTGKQLEFIELDFLKLPRQDFYPISVDPPIKVSKEKNYSFTIYVKDRASAVGIGRMSYKDVYDGGRAWYFSRLIGPNGEILDEKHDWRSYNDDVTFTLTFVRQEISDQ